jgi:uncharacterized protein
MLLDTVKPMPSAIHGRGLIACQDICCGCIVWHPCTSCKAVGKEELAQMCGEEFHYLDEYGYYLRDGGVLLPCSNAHLMNHSCESAVIDFGLDFAVAVRDISQNEEVTCDYRTFCNDPDWILHCTCGARDCVGTIHPSQGAERLLHDTWKRRLGPALNRILAVSQPLAGTLEGSSASWRYIRRTGKTPPLTPAMTIRAPAFLEYGNHADARLDIES